METNVLILNCTMLLVNTSILLLLAVKIFDAVKRR